MKMMNEQELHLLAVLLERAQVLFTPIEVAWAGGLLNREAQKLQIANELKMQQEAKENDLPPFPSGQPSEGPSE